MSGFVVTRSGRYIEKDPDDTLDYVIDMTEFLADGDTLTASAGDLEVTVTGTGLVKNSASTNAAVVTVVEGGVTRDIAAYKAVVIWLTGPAPGTSGQVHTRVTSTKGRTKDVTFKVIAKEG